MRAIPAVLVLMCAAVPPAVVTAWWQPPVSLDAASIALPEGHIAVADAMALDRVLWIDARDSRGTENGSTGARRLGLPLTPGRWNEQLMAVLSAWEPGVPAVVFCGSASCGNSREVAERLRDEAGLDEVSVLHGGWEAYQRWQGQ